MQTSRYENPNTNLETTNTAGALVAPPTLLNGTFSHCHRVVPIQTHFYLLVGSDRSGSGYLISESPRVSAGRRDQSSGSTAQLPDTYCQMNAKRPVPLLFIFINNNVTQHLKVRLRAHGMGAATRLFLKGSVHGRLRSTSLVPGRFKRKVFPLNTIQ